MSSKKVAIIGAGASGLVSAKYAIENGLSPVIFEKTANIGGLWSTKDTAIWEGLKTNVSRYICMFSDHPWPNDTRLFPLAHEVHKYLLSYARKFHIDKYVRLNHKVTFIRRLETKKWEIKFHNLLTNETRLEIFDFLIIASGIYCKPRITLDENSSKFNGLILHSSQFRLKDPRLDSKNVLVIGGSLSGVDIAGFFFI